MREEEVSWGQLDRDRRANHFMIRCKRGMAVTVIKSIFIAMLLTNLKLLAKGAADDGGSFTLTDANWTAMLENEWLVKL